MDTVLRKELVVNRTLIRTFGVAVFVILTALGAFVRIPLPGTPVPFTLQTLFVLLAGAFLGSRLGGLSQASYVALGALGLPLFANAGSGYLYLTGPTSGYLAGFIFSSMLLGSLMRYVKANFLMIVVAFALADIVLFACGLLWLRLVFGYTFSKLLLIGVVPFLPGEAVKIFLASSLYRGMRGRLGS